MYPKSVAGATALLAAPILAIAGALAQPTLSGDAAKQVLALTSHREAMIAGMTLSMIAAVLLTGGISSGLPVDGGRGNRAVAPG
jgi:hypothetical protein